MCNIRGNDLSMPTTFFANGTACAKSTGGTRFPDEPVYKRALQVRNKMKRLMHWYDELLNHPADQEGKDATGRSRP